MTSRLPGGAESHETGEGSIRNDDERGCGARLQSLLDRELPVTVVVGEKALPLAEITALSAGSLISFEGSAPQRCTLHVLGVPIGHGTVVTVAHRLALRLDSVREPREILESLRLQRND